MTSKKSLFSIDKTIWQFVAIVLGVLLAVRFGSSLTSKLVKPFLKLLQQFVFGTTKLKIADLIGAFVATAIGWLFGGWFGAIIGSTIGSRLIGLLMMTPIGAALKWCLGHLVKLMPIPVFIQTAWQSALELVSLALGSVLFVPIILMLGIEISYEANEKAKSSVCSLFDKSKTMMTKGFLSMSDSMSVFSNIKIMSFFSDRDQQNFSESTLKVYSDFNEPICKKQSRNFIVQ